MVLRMLTRSAGKLWFFLILVLWPIPIVCGGISLLPIHCSHGRFSSSGMPVSIMNWILELVLRSQLTFTLFKNTEQVMFPIFHSPLWVRKSIPCWLVTRPWDCRDDSLVSPYVLISSDRPAKACYKAKPHTWCLLYSFQYNLCLINPSTQECSTSIFSFSLSPEIYHTVQRIWQ